MKLKMRKGYLILYGILFLALLYRSFLSVELTDEVHGIASIYNIYLGKKPFMTSWDYHTGWCLLAPLFSLFHMVSPEFEGIVLFFRIVYLLFTVVCAGIISWMLYRKEQNPWIWYFVFPAICFVPTSIFQISYNSLTVYLLMLAAVILITSEAGKTEWVRYLCLGILMGIGCINYPTLAALAVGLTVWIGIKNKNGYWKSKTVFYIVGGSMTALVFFWWILSDGDMTLFVQALKGMFTSPHEKTKGTIDGQYLLQTFFEPLKEFFLSGFGICSLIYLAVQFVFDVCLHRRFWNWVFLCLFLMMNAWSNKGTYGYVVLGILIAYSYLLLTDRRLWRQSKELLGILLGYILTYSFTSDNRNVMAAFEVAGPLICLCAGVILWEAAKEKHVAQPIFPLLLLGISGVLSIYTYVYRDEPVGFLNQRVESGIYKGLYTTESRKQMVEQVEQEIDSVITENETVCVVTRAPMIYLMAKANICAPQTWDAQFLYRGNISAEPLLSYFEAVNQIPDVLVATSLDNPDFINQEQYEIQKFIKEYYSLYYDNQIESMDIWVWKRKNKKY